VQKNIATKVNYEIRDKNGNYIEFNIFNQVWPAGKRHTL